MWEQLVLWTNADFQYRDWVLHTVRGKTNPEGWPYGIKHDSDCPACKEAYLKGAAWTSLPWSETYWAS